MKNRVVPLRVPEELLQLAALRSQEQRTNRATVLRQWLYNGAEEYALRLVEEGRLSAARAAEMLEISLYDLYRLAETQGMGLGATDQQYQRSLADATQHWASQER